MSFLRKIDALAAMLSVLFLGLAAIGSWCVYLGEIAKSARPLHLSIAAASAILASATDIAFVVLVFRCFFASVPKLPMAVAMRQYVLPWLVRPLLATYWLAHFIAGAIFVMSLHRSLSREYDTARMGLGGLVFAGVFGYSLTYAANAYLLAAVASLTRNPRVLVVAWRLRLLVDLGVAIGTPLVFGRSQLIWTWLG